MGDGRDAQNPGFTGKISAPSREQPGMGVGTAAAGAGPMGPKADPPGTPGDHGAAQGKSADVREMPAAIVPQEHMGLVRLCAKRFIGKGIEHDDLFQAGCIGLMKAAAGFDPTLGYQFSTYAVPVILGEIKGLFRSGSMVKLSRGIWELAKQAQERAEAHREKTGDSPSVSVLAEGLGVSVEKLVTALELSRSPLSLTGDEESGGVEIPVEAPEKEMTDRMTLHQLMEDLPEKDRRLIQLRYFRNKTQRETADCLGMTQVQVSRREKKLLMQMRAQL